MYECFDNVTYRTIFPWMAHETQYWSFKYILGTVYSGKTEASEISPVQALDHSLLNIFMPLRRSLSAGLGKRTDGGRLNHVADGESLDRLVLGSASRAVGAADGLDVAATLLVTAATTMLVLPSRSSLLLRYCILGRSLLDHVGLILVSCKPKFVCESFRGAHRRCGI